MNENDVTLSWKSPARPFKRQDREFFKTIASIVVLISVILIFLKEFFLIAVVLALLFVAYALFTVPPEETEHKITADGVETLGHFYKWDELKGFHFDERLDHPVLNVDTKVKFPSRLVLLIDRADEAKIKELLESHLTMDDKPEKIWVTKFGEWAGKKLKK